MQNFAEAFMTTLRQAEDSRDPEPLVALFGAGSELITVSLTEPMSGVEGARRFWTTYLSAFERIRSTFHHVIQTEGAAVLEWIGEGVVAASGQAFNYRGISVLEHDGRHIRRFRSYYDSAVFVPGGAKHKEAV
jgi:ketosteroid isomerase-like protein